MKKTLFTLLALAWMASTVHAQQGVVIYKNPLRTNVVLVSGVPTQLFSNASETICHSLYVGVTNGVGAVVWGGTATNRVGGYYLAPSVGSIILSFPSGDARTTWWGEGVGGNAAVLVVREPQ